METRSREQLWTLLRAGDVDEADTAMSQLLDVEDPTLLDPDDVTAALDAIERLGTPGRSRMFETFMLLTSRYPTVSVPPLIAYMERHPTTWSAGLAAATIGEIIQNVPSGRSQLDRKRVLAAFERILEVAQPTDGTAVSETIRTLQMWAGLEPLPEVAPALTQILLRAAQEADPEEYFLGLAVEALVKSGGRSQLEAVRSRANMLPPHHPLRRVMAAPPQVE